MARSRPTNILITGASSGIGRELAMAYSAPGVQLAVTGRDAARLSETSESCRSRGATVVGETIDVRDTAGMRAWIEQFDDAWPIDLVIANAGVSAGTAGIEDRPSAGPLIRAINIEGVANTIEPVLPRMVRRGHGQLGLVSSLAGFRGLPNAPDYSASKAWVLAYSEALRARWASAGIQVSAICPGFVESRITDLNDFAMPGYMDAATGAKIIQRGLRRNYGIIAFPRRTAWPARLLGILPAWLTNPVLTGLPTKE